MNTPQDIVRGWMDEWDATEEKIRLLRLELNLNN